MNHEIEFQQNVFLRLLRCDRTWQLKHDQSNKNYGVSQWNTNTIHQPVAKWFPEVLNQMNKIKCRVQLTVVVFSCHWKTWKSALIHEILLQQWCLNCGLGNLFALRKSVGYGLKASCTRHVLSHHAVSTGAL